MLIKIKIEQIINKLGINRQIVNNGKPLNAKINNLAKICTGGASMSEDYIMSLRSLFPDIDFFPAYGQTEVGALAVFEHYSIKHRQYAREKPKCVGMPVRGVLYKVVDPETGIILGANQVGELRVKTKRIMNGYYNENCVGAFDNEGWFKTGDLVMFDQDGCFFIMERLKDLLKFRSHHIPTFALEQQLLKHPAVEQAIVIGKPDISDGDHPMAIVVVAKNSNVSPEEIQDFVDKRVVDKNKLRGGVKFVDCIPLTTTGKINKMHLKKMVLG